MSTSEVYIGTPNVALTNDAIAIYEKAMTKYLGSNRPLQASEIDYQVKRRYGGSSQLANYTKTVKDARNEVRHKSGEDIEKKVARRHIRRTAEALRYIGHRKAEREVNQDDCKVGG